MIKFNQKETEFLNQLEENRIATTHEGIPHVKPVSYVVIDDQVIIATDYKTRTYLNIKSNANTAIVMDIYKSGNHKAVCIQGRTEIVEEGPEFRKIYGIFSEKFEWVRRDPWKEGEAPFLKIVPSNKISWGLN